MLNYSKELLGGTPPTNVHEDSASAQPPPAPSAQDVCDKLGDMTVKETATTANTAAEVARTDSRVEARNETFTNLQDKLRNECTRPADLRKEIYRPLPSVTLPADMPSPNPMTVCTEILSSLFEALAQGDVAKVKDSFYRDQSYWRDQLALTYHFRTFKDKDMIAQTLVERTTTNKLDKLVILPGTARLTPAGPTLTWIDCFFIFETANPAASCAGMVQLLPPKADDTDRKWKIWTLATWIRDFQGLEENEARLKQESVKHNPATEEPINVDVLIVGAGNAGLCLAVRLKAYGLTYLAIDKAENIGDNWALRYDNMRFHVPKTFAETPLLPYPEDAPKYLHKNDLASQCKRIASTFDLDVWTNTTIKSTSQDPNTKEWSLTLITPNGERKVRTKQLVQATGVGSRHPYIPNLDSQGTEYKGISMHSQQFKNGELLTEQGIKSVIVVGSANTAFDVVQACHEAGLNTTMVQRRPTFILPTEYLDNPNGLGVYALLPADVADSVTTAGPIAVGGQLVYGLHQMLAAAESSRYDKLRAAGFRVDSSGDLMHNLLERGGGHYIDMGQTELIANGDVKIKSGLAPTSFTPGGLKLSDGSELVADAIIWCTGYADKNVRAVSQSIFGDGGDELASRMDDTWQLDSEGEIRGMWKRQLNIDNFWITGGFTSQHRYYSRFLAIQLKAVVEGKLPPAYRDNPKIVMI